MRILIAPDKFKGTFSAAEVCRHLAEGIRQSDPNAEVVLHPMADGGDGTLDVLLRALGGERVSVEASDSMDRPVVADVGKLGDGRILVESASFVGIAGLSFEGRDPLRTTSHGLGLALAKVLSWGPSEVLVGLGGSATVDGGLGCARALGYRLLGDGDEELSGTGADLPRLRRIERPSREPRRGSTRLGLLCDVRSPLTGPTGAAVRFAPQKGASPEQVSVLEEGLANLARILERDLGSRVEDLPGSGAAGGLGAGLAAFAGGELLEGAPEIARLTGLSRDIGNADLILTGEGRFDSGSRGGKVVSSVVSAASGRNVRIIVVCGDWDGSPVPDGVQVVSHGGFMKVEDLRNTGKCLAQSGFS
jgi:glycerate kinase